MRNAYARATRARRNTRVNAARCNETLLTPTFDLEAVKPEDVGLLGAATCGHCHAAATADTLTDFGCDCDSAEADAAEWSE